MSKRNEAEFHFVGQEQNPRYPSKQTIKKRERTYVEKVFHICGHRDPRKFCFKHSRKSAPPGRDMRFWTAGVSGWAATYFFKLMSDQLNAEECNIRGFCRGGLAHLLPARSKPFRLANAYAGATSSVQ